MARYERGIATLAEIHLGGLSQGTAATGRQSHDACQDDDHCLQETDEGGDTVPVRGCTAYLLNNPSEASHTLSAHTPRTLSETCLLVGERYGGLQDSHCKQAMPMAVSEDWCRLPCSYRLSRLPGVRTGLSHPMDFHDFFFRLEGQPPAWGDSRVLSRHAPCQRTR